MATRIKRTPVLKGRVAKTFLRNIDANKIEIDKEKIEKSLAATKRILSKFRQGK